MYSCYLNTRSDIVKHENRKIKSYIGTKHEDKYSVREKYKALIIVVLQQHHSAGRLSVAVHGRNAHRVRVQCLCITGVFQPFFKLANRIIIQILAFESLA